MPELTWLASAFPNFLRYIVVSFALAGLFLWIYVADHAVARVRY